MIKKILLFCLLIILIGVSYFFYFLNTPNSNNSETKKFIVTQGLGSTKISQELKKQGLIKNDILFELYLWFNGTSSRLLPGEYWLQQNLTPEALAKLLSQGTGETKETTLTFIEGWNSQEIAQYLANKNFGSAKDFFAIIQKKADWWDQYQFLASKPRNLDLEGYLFPDTYRVYRDASLESIVQKMLDNFNKKLTPELVTEINKQQKTVHEIITLASIIEKEVSNDNDRKLVADIFYKRLEKGIGLQSDATVNYVTGKSTTRPSAQDLAVDSPYNTYKYKGLPPGPISNPGISAILAAIYPTSNPYFYFLTTPDGKVIYSKAYQEHLQAKAQYYK
jgi:UPF0755 protein